MVFSLYMVLWATVIYAIMALFDSININPESERIRGVRGFATTIWWTFLAGWMIFLGARNGNVENQENIGFALLALTIFKILFIDLHRINTNLKVFVFVIVRGLMRAISSFASKRARPDTAKKAGLAINGLESQ